MKRELVCQIGRRSPGITWRRGACAWEGYEGRAYIWIRSGWRIAAAWAAAVAVLALIGYGVGK